MSFVAYKFRLYPNAVQERTLSAQTETLRRVYNDVLDLYKTYYAVNGKSPPKGWGKRVVTLSRQAQVADAKAGVPGPKWLASLYSCSVRDVASLVETAFDNFFRRLKRGEKKVGFPRFKGRNRSVSIPFRNAYPAGCVLRLRSDPKSVLKSDFPASRRDYRLHVYGVGAVKCRAHRDVVGTVSGARVLREPDGRWYVVLLAECERPDPTPSTNPAVGIDVGLRYFLTTSDGEHRPNHRFLKKSLKKLRRLQRSASRKLLAAKKRKAKVRDCKNLRKSFHAVARLHARVRNIRRENHHQEALRLVRKYGTVCAENLNIKNMVRNRKRSRAIHDVAWGGFVIVLKHKAERAGVRFVEVDPRGTSQTCPECGGHAPKEQGEDHDCPHCHLRMQRDHAAARVILARGLGLNPSGPDGAVHNHDNSRGGPRSLSPSRNRSPRAAPSAKPSKGAEKGHRSRKKSQPSVPSVDT